MKLERRHDLNHAASRKKLSSCLAGLVRRQPFCSSPKLLQI